MLLASRREERKLHDWAEKDIYLQPSSKIQYRLDASCLLQGNQVSIKNPK